ncbi:MAG: hypothetical protein NZ899_08045 [Thermoguttaceae bacterium]|nr:hypothetical protein [Thermoguttaceae bacterium]MDW8078104.1 hypothetical protein [Thermoguttaceae bacterium]
MVKTFNCFSSAEFYELLRTELIEALSDPRLEAFDESPWDVSPEAEAAAYELALALGRCAICGVDLPEEIDGTLPAPEATAAARRLAEVCKDLCELIKTLGERWEEAETPEEGELLVAEVFEGLMETYAVMEALSQAYLAMEEDDDPNLRRFIIEFDRAAEAIRQLDEKAQDPEVLPLLSMVVDLPLYENWKSSLANSFASAPPWWLSGILEATAEQVNEETDSLVREAIQRAGGIVPPVSAISSHRVIPEQVFPAKVVSLAAAGPSEVGSRRESRFWWRSPDGKFFARLTIPRQYPESGRVPVEILGAKGLLAREWAGQPVRLNGVEVDADENAIARFPLEEVRKAVEDAGGQLTLEVGAPPQLWESIEEPNFEL